jgi:hypothetical protein
MAPMARHFDEGMDVMLNPAFAPGEHLLAAVKATNAGHQPTRRGSDLMPPVVLGGLIGGTARAAARATSNYVAPKQAVSHGGTAGTVPLGEVLVALTNGRLYFFRRKKTQVFAPPLVFAAGDLRSSTSVMRMMLLSFTFDDRTTVKLKLTKTDYNANVLTNWLNTMIEEVRPPEPAPVRNDADEPPPPGDWLASPPRVVEESAQFAQTAEPPADPPTAPQNETP